MTSADALAAPGANKAGAAPRPSVWILTDGKIGDLVQCRGVAARLSDRVEERTTPDRRVYAWTAPWGPLDPRDAPGRTGSILAPPFPDLLIASGRRTVPFARAVKKASGGATRVVFLKDPRAHAFFADLIWIPVHDRRQGPNVFRTLTSPHGLRAEIEAARTAPHPAIGALPGPFLGVVLGGPSGGARYDRAAAYDLADRLTAAARDFEGVAVTPSRRTPDHFTNALAARMEVDTAFVWDRRGDNPYASILAHAGALVVAGDSHNMLSEAAASQAGLYVWRPVGLADKMAQFIERLEADGRARPFADRAEPFDATPLDATDDIAGAIAATLGVSLRDQ